MKQMEDDKRVGITTTVPIEIIYSAGLVPVDLNNLFIAKGNALQLVDMAESAGYPRSFCAWVKGIYSSVLESGIKKVVGVIQGDCSNTHVLLDTLSEVGIKTVPFTYPYDKSEEIFEIELARFADRFGTTVEEAERWKVRLDRIRAKVNEIDRANIDRRYLKAGELNLLLLSTSDMLSDPDSFERKVDSVYKGIRGNAQKRTGKRIGMVGIPPIFTDFFDFIEGTLGLECVYIEVARQFALPLGGESIFQTYLKYTYPYGIFTRLEDIKVEIDNRAIDGIIHYVQGFCYRQVELIILRNHIKIPIIQIEGDKPGVLDEATKVCLQAFAELLA
jgi:benzoyl-CoA reductase/2-hydroxyglutaryl-CoA dehydratase subunit BcrC/BadD/HgdB